MKIIHVNSVFQGGGVDTQTLDLCAGLIGLGHEVMLLTPPKARWVPRANAIDGLQVEHYDGGKPGWGFRLRRLSEQFGAQILHGHHGRDYWVTGLAARLASNKPGVVLTRHLMTPLSSTSARYLLWLGHVTAASKAVMANLQRELKGDQARRLHLIYAGIDSERFRPDEGLRREVRTAFGWNESHVLFALIGGAGLPDGKGQREFVEAGAKLIREQPEVRLLIVGEGSLIPVLEARIAELDLREQIRIVPFTDQVERIDAAIDVLVHPAVGTEALGLVIWEAMSAAKPIIASRLDGIPETFVEPDHGQLVTPRSVDELYAAMKRFAADGALRQSAGDAARSYLLAQGYTRRGMAERFVSLYEAIARQQRP